MECRLRALLLLLLFGAFAAGEPQGAIPSQYSKSLILPFNTTASGANVSGNVTNVPILVRFTSSDLDFTAMQETGRDLFFQDKDGSYLYYEILEWDKANKKGRVFVRVPQVDGNSSSDHIKAFYGCDTCVVSSYNRADSVWSAYKAVYHLKGFADSAYEAKGRPTTGVYARNIPASPGLANLFTPAFGGASDSLSIADHADFDQTTALSVLAWVKNDAASPTTQAVVGRYGADGAKEWALRYDNSSGSWQALFGNGSGAFGGSRTGSSSASSLTSWHHVGFTYSAGTVALYDQGAALSASTAGSLPATLYNSGAKVMVGSQEAVTSGAPYPWDGQIEDVRIAASVLSADYVKLTYENMKSGSAFIGTLISTSSFNSSKRFQFNTTSTGANVTGNVTNFPLLVRLTGSSLVDACQSAGEDIRFLDKDGVTWLDYEIERFSQSADSAEVWVEVPQVDGNSATDYITLYYDGKSTLLDGQNKSGIWDSITYGGVWHLGESGNGTLGEFKDATPWGNHGQGGEGTASAVPDRIGGLIGYAQTFDTTAGDRIKVPDHNSLDSAANFSVSCWVKRRSAGGGSRGRMVVKGWISSFGLLHQNGQTEYTWDNTGFTAPNGTTTLNQWNLLTVTLGGGKSYAYLNGVLTDSGTHATALPNTADDVWIGDNGAGTRTLDGTLDEVRVVRSTYSANFVKLSYETQKSSPTLFLPATASFSGSKKITFNTTPTGANVSSNVTNFPLLVRLSSGDATDAAIFTAAQDAGQDIRFLDKDGVTWLDYEIERWDESLNPKKAEIWVKVPQIDGNSTADYITMYYGCASCTDNQTRTAVWDTTQYLGVWHLGESANNNSDNYRDATARSAHGTGTALQASHSDTGIIGKAFKRPVSWSGDVITVPSGKVSMANKPYSMGGWFYQDLYGGFRCPLFHGTGGGIGDMAFLFLDSTSIQFSQFGDDLNYSGSRISGWFHVYATCDTGARNRRIYLNGKQVAVDSSDYAFDGTGAFQMGQNDGGTWPYAGTIDEVRLSAKVLDSNHIRLSYETQRASAPFFTTRSGPNNLSTLTATHTGSGIALSWTKAVSDSSNADTVGIWMKTSGYPDSAKAGTLVGYFTTSESTFTSNAYAAGTYYFGLAVRNAAGYWSPITGSSRDTAVIATGTNNADSVYVDSATGSNSNTCTQAKSPATPKKTLTSAAACAVVDTDTLFIFAAAGTYTDSILIRPSYSSQKIVVQSLNRSQPAILSGHASDGGKNFAVRLMGAVHLRNLDIRASTDGDYGIVVQDGDDSVRIEGCRVYNGPSAKFHTGIDLGNWGSNDNAVSNNVIHGPTSVGIRANGNSRVAIHHNLILAEGETDTGIVVGGNDGKYTLKNNILVGHSVGLYMFYSGMGTVTKNLYYDIPTGSESKGAQTDASPLTSDPLLLSTLRGDAAYAKLSASSPAINAGTASGDAESPWVPATDLFGSTRSQGSAPDIGPYEGSGYSPASPSLEQDTLLVASTSDSIIVRNDNWKIVFRRNKGGGIAHFAEGTDTTTSLIPSGKTLFDLAWGTDTLSTFGSGSSALTLVSSTRVRAQVRQSVVVSASKSVDVYYSILASGHVMVEAEMQNTSSSTLSAQSVAAFTRLSTAAYAYREGLGDRGYGYLLGSSRDLAFAPTNPLSFPSDASWSDSAASGSSGLLLHKTSSMQDIARNGKRVLGFLLYLGDKRLTGQKAKQVSEDVQTPTPLVLTSGGAWGERAWQEDLLLQLKLDEGQGDTLFDISGQARHGKLYGGSWTAGKRGTGLSFTTAASDSAHVVHDAAFGSGRVRGISLWVRKSSFTASDADAVLLAKGSDWVLHRSGSTNKVAFTLGGTTIADPDTCPDAAWFHVAGLFQGGYLSLYVDGKLKAVSTGTVPSVTNSTNVTLGRLSDGTRRFVGNLDDIRLYGYPFSEQSVQSLRNEGFARRMGYYAVNADNNNRIVAVLNDSLSTTRIQPALRIDNWYGDSLPRYVYVDGTRMTAGTDYLVARSEGALGSYRLELQFNKTFTGNDIDLLVDDDDSTGFLGASSAMPTLSTTVTANDKIAFQNFSGTTFGTASSGQWYLELDLNGWTTPTRTTGADTGFGSFNAWKAAAISPSTALASATQLVGYDAGSRGRQLIVLKYDNTGTNQVFSGGTGYASPANLGYRFRDSSAVRISVVLDTIILTSSPDTIKVLKRYTLYPTGKLYTSYHVPYTTLSCDQVRLELLQRYDAASTYSWNTSSTAGSAGRMGRSGGGASWHSMAAALLVHKAVGTTVTNGSIQSATPTMTQSNTGGSDYAWIRFQPAIGNFDNSDDPWYTHFVMDISKDFADSASGDSLLRDPQNPGTLSALIGSRVTTDSMDLDGDGFAEGDGAYVYQASSNIAHFKLDAAVARVYPAFRITGWTGELPAYVLVDNQSQVLGYHYNAAVNAKGRELILQFNRKFKIGSYNIYIGLKDNLAVKMAGFAVKGGSGADTAFWTTESEKDNLGYNLYRRLAGSSAGASSGPAAAEFAGSARMAAAALPAFSAAPGVKLSLEAAGPGDGRSGTALDTSWLRVNPALIPGAPDGLSTRRRDYAFAAAKPVAGPAGKRGASGGGVRGPGSVEDTEAPFEYLLEAVDVNGITERFGPVTASDFVRPSFFRGNYPNPFNPRTTIRFSLGEAAPLELSLFDARGRLLTRLLSSQKPFPAGNYRLSWEAVDGLGREMPSGPYFCRMKAGRFVKTHRMLLMK